MSDQPTLFDDLPPVSHSDDPETSSQQPSDAERVTIMKRLLAEIERCPMTAEEASEAIGVHHWAGRKRMSDLHNTGQIMDSGARRQGSSGRQAVVWMAVER